MSLLGRLVCENLLAQGCMPAHKHHDCELFLPTGARRQGALAPQLPRNTRSSAFQPEDLLIFTDYECFTGCFILCLQVMTIVSIVSLLTPHFFPFILRGVGGVFSGCLALFRARENEATQKQYFKTKKSENPKKKLSKKSKSPKYTPVSLGYPLSVFNKNSTLTCLVSFSFGLRVFGQLRRLFVRCNRGWRAVGSLQRSGTVLWVLRGSSDVHHPLSQMVTVQCLSWVFTTQANRKERPYDDPHTHLLTSCSASRNSQQQ